MERQVAAALRDAGIAFLPDRNGGNPSGLDFYIPAADVHIEVKRFHSDRIAEQMSRAPNVIGVQGEKAVALLCRFIRCMGLGPFRPRMP